MYFETGEYNPPSRDIFNQKLNGCLSTRFVLVCQKDAENLVPTSPGVTISDSYVPGNMFHFNKRLLVYRKWSPAQYQPHVLSH